MDLAIYAKFLDKLAYWSIGPNRRIFGAGAMVLKFTVECLREAQDSWVSQRPNQLTKVWR
jgi:hypothetical protein